MKTLLKKACAALLALALFPVAAPAANAPAFADVPQDAWYADAVQAACAAGLMTGRTETAFAPRAFVTYAEATMLAARVLARQRGDELPQTDPWWNGAAQYLDEQGVLAPLQSASPAADAYRFLSDGQTLSDFLNFRPVDLLSPQDLLSYQQLFSAEEQAFLYIPRATEVCPRLFFGLLAGCVLEADAAEPNTIDAVPDYRPEMDAYAPAYDELLLRLYRAGVLTGSDSWGSSDFPDTLYRSEAAALILRLYDPSARQTVSFAALPGELTALDRNFVSTLLSDDDLVYYQWLLERNDNDYVQLFRFDAICRLLEDGVLACPDEQSDGKTRYGYCDSTGNWAIAPKFRFADDFGDFSYALAADENGWYTLDRSGAVLHAFERIDGYWITHMEAISDTAVMAYGQNTMGDDAAGLYRTDGTALLPMTSTECSGSPLFSDGLIWLRSGQGLYGAFDETGAPIIPEGYEEVTAFYEGRALVRPAGSDAYQIINKTGRVLVDGLAAGCILNTDRYGLYVLIGYTDDMAQSILIDQSGRTLLSASYINIYSEDLLYTVSYDADGNCLSQYYDRQGRPVSEVEATLIYAAGSVPAGFTAPETGPWQLAATEGAYAEYALLQADGTPFTPYLFHQPPLWLPPMQQYLVAIQDVPYLYDPAA